YIWRFSRMNIGHWGVNFNENANSHYRFMLENKIVVGSSPPTDYQVGDLVAVHKGQGLLAIARVVGSQQALPQLWKGRDLLARYGIDQRFNPIYAPAEFRKV